MTANQVVKDVAQQDYKYGFVTDVEVDLAPRGLSEDTVRFISAKKDEPEWLLEWRLKAYRHFMSLVEKEQIPEWANIHYPPIDFQDIIYYAAPKKKKKQSLDEVDPEVLETYEKLGIPLREQEMLEALRWMRSSTVCRWRLHSRRSFQSWESFSARFPKQSRTIRSW